MGELPEFIARPDPARYLSDSYLVLDLETEVNDGRFGSSIDKRNHLSLACYVGPDTKLRSRWGGEFNQAQLVRACQEVDFIVAHNAKYELGWLTRCGLATSRLLVFDTQLAEYVLLGNLVAGDADTGLARVGISLDACCERRGFQRKDPIVDVWMKNGIKVSEMPRSWVNARCKQDVMTTKDLFLHQRKELAETNRLGVLLTRCLLTPVLSSIENEGMHLDEERVTKFHRDHTEDLRKLELEFSELTGGINWRSGKQVAEFVYDVLKFEELTDRRGNPKRTASGKRAVSRKVLEKLRAYNEPQKSFIALRKRIGKVGAALSKNLDYFKLVCDTTKEKVFHAEFNQSITATHRLSSTGIALETATEGSKSCQLTNIPRDFKCLFSARRDGWYIGEADGAQLEFRVAAYLGNDRQARADIADRSFDAHCVTASEMYGKSYTELREAYLAGDKVATSLRQSAKPETFKPLYGGSKGTPEQERWYEAFKRRYPDLARTQKDWVYEVLANKCLITPWGMRYYWPNIRISSSGYVNNGSAIYNYPIQALATAEIIPIAIVYFWHEVRRRKLEERIIPINTVHDSLVCEIHPDNVQDFKDIATVSFGPKVYEYLARVYGINFDVALGCGVKVGTHWSEGQEERYEFDGKSIERVK